MRSVGMAFASKWELGEQHHRDFSVAAVRLTRNDRFPRNVIPSPLCGSLDMTGSWPSSFCGALS